MEKKFAIGALNPKYKIFIVYIAAFSVDSDDEVHPSKKAQIAHLIANEVLIKVFSKYTDFADVFLPKLVVKLLKYIKINNYTIELIDN